MFRDNRDPCRPAFHHSIQHPPHSARVVPTGHEHKGPELMLLAPRRKRLGFAFGCFNFSSGYLHDIPHSEKPELASLPCSSIVVGKASANELALFSNRRGSKNRDASCDTTVHQVRSFERPCAGRSNRYNNDVDRRDRLAQDEGPSCSSKHWLPHEGESKDASGGYKGRHCDQDFAQFSNLRLCFSTCPLALRPI